MPAEPRFSSAPQTILAVQRELTQLGYYHGQIDGLSGPQTENAVRWFQSIDKLPVIGQVDGPTVKALRVSLAEA
jgi:peptidoglycan hydrolase-like protein with peptidoglycan-binding domain